MLSDELLFEALASARRRELLRVIAADRPTSGELAARFEDCTWQATSKHLGVLLAAEFVRKVDVTGPRKELVINEAALRRVRDWVEGCPKYQRRLLADDEIDF